MQRMVI